MDNVLSEIKQAIKNQSYSEILDDDDMFYFGAKLDNKNEVILGDGTDANHANILVTSKRLMENIEMHGVHHIDCTYKIFKQGFPLLVYGVTDMVGRFHPIAFMVTSHECEEDFYLFYKSINLSIIKVFYCK